MCEKLSLRKKYTGTYYYEGTREYFCRCQQDIKELYKAQPILEVRKLFGERYKKCDELKKKIGN